MLDGYRPELLLDSRVRPACSAWSLLDPAVLERFTTELSRDLERGAWDAAYGHLPLQVNFDGSLELVIGRR
jgi:hypothetical protein